MKKIKTKITEKLTYMAAPIRIAHNTTRLMCIWGACLIISLIFFLTGLAKPEEEILSKIFLAISLITGAICIGAYNFQRLLERIYEKNKDK